MPKIKVTSDKVKYTEKYMTAKYEYSSTRVSKRGDEFSATPITICMEIRTERTVPKVGIMLVGWSGNNGSTLTAALLANKHNYTWLTKDGECKANWFGSITQSSTIRLGITYDNEEVYVPLASMLPMLNPDDIMIDGWDISSANLAEGMVRAKVLNFDLQKKLMTEMAKMVPRPGIYDPDFIAANQADRAKHIIVGTRYEQFMKIRNDIREFRIKNKLDKIIVMWTANTERFCEVTKGVHDTADNLMAALKKNNKEISPSIIYAMAAINEKCCYINGSPQNTCVPGIVEMAEKEGVFIAGDDFKSGQTKLKSVLVDFLISAGLKPKSIVSYNHLGNNDGKNLSAPDQFRSKEISKSNVVDDMVASNSILYEKGEKPDHVVVIKYVPYVGDSKRAMDEYTSEILLNGTNTLVIHNTCEDSLLAVPLMLDLIVLTELFTRMMFRADDDEDKFYPLDPVLSILSYFLKAPLVPTDSPLVNSLFKQRNALDNLLRAAIGLPPETDMILEHKVQFMMQRRLLINQPNGLDCLK